MAKQKYGPVQQQKAAQKRRDRLAIINGIKEQTPCADCGQFFLGCQMDFEHVDPSTKELKIGPSLGSASMKRIMDEIAKCEIVCSNCHRLRTWLRANGIS